jgi:hypothetical protein
MSYGISSADRRRLLRMIPLHLRSTTIHVTAEQAELLTASAFAEWLPGVRALLVKVDEARALAALHH